MSQEVKSVVVIGGGLVGLSCAYYMAKAGRRVTVVERDHTLLSGSSGGNAGMVVPSHFIPLAAPGVIVQGLKWMFDPQGPFSIRPRMDLDLAHWIWTFWRHSNARHVKRSAVLLRDLGLESRSLHVELARSGGYSLEKRGLLMLCQSPAGLREEVEVAERAQRLGLEVSVFDQAGLKEYEPEVAIEARGGVWFRQDCHLSPMDFVKALRNGITSAGGEFVEGEAVEFEQEGERVKGVRLASGDTVEGDRVVLASGIVTTALVKKLGLRLPMQGGKGYSLTLKEPRRHPQVCSLLKEGRVAVTPMGNTLRVAGTMEICGEDSSIDFNRVQGIIRSFCRFYPEFEESDFYGVDPWVGLRPCSPDGLPYLGTAPGHPEVVIASGHAMTGLSLAPVTGMLVEKMVSGQESPIKWSPLDPARFS